MNSLLLYLDPGSGSVIVQALIAAFLGAGVFFKSIKLWASQFFGNKTKDEE